MFTDRTTVAARTPCTLMLPGDRTYTACLVSADAVLQLHVALRDPDADDDARTLALYRFVRAAFPWRWWYRFRDPVPAILALPPDLVQRVLARLFYVPGRDVQPRDPIEEEMARQRAMARPHAAAAARGPSLAMAILTCEERMGADWYFAPHRWPTSDGYAPFATVWLTYDGLMARNAQQQLQDALAYALGMAGPDANPTREKLALVANPHDTERVA